MACTCSNEALKVKRIEEEAKAPTRKHITDAGMDVYALEEVVIPPHTIQVVRTGVTADYPDNTVALVWPKSRSDFLIGAGVIDCGYQGEILVKVTNISDQDLKIEKHQGLAQIVIVPVVCPPVVEVDEIHQEESDRGVTGGIAGNAKEE
jgi:dUTP pyrophosphatase